MLACEDSTPLPALPRGEGRKVLTNRGRVLRPSWPPRMPANRVTALRRMASPGFTTNHAPADRRSFLPEVALHLVKMACERPDD